MDNASTTDGLHKSAIIYRDDAARFIYVCFHCGRMFKEINETLQHIESHFQLVKATFDDANTNPEDAPPAAPEQVDIKVEFMDDEEDTSKFLAFLNVEPQQSSKDMLDSSCSNVPKTEKGKKKKPLAVKQSIEKDKLTTNEKRLQKTEDRPYRCHKCQESCESVTSLKSHLKKHGEDLFSVFKCKVCDLFCQNSCALRIHVLAEHLKKKKLKCNACAAEFSAKQHRQFMDHLQEHKLWADIRDGINHKTSDEFTSYEEIDSFDEEQYPCGQCSQKFHLKCNLDVHLKRIHLNERRLQCAQCDAVLPKPKHFYAHQLAHQKSGKSNITEDDIKVFLTDLDGLIDERIIYHGSESASPFRCLICNATFKASHKIRSHIQRQHVYKMFPPPVEPKHKLICDICGATLKSKYAMEKHFMIHTNTKTFPCTYCGRTFRLGSTRKIHERQHTGEKPYQCHECGKAFVSKGLLTAHKLTHEDTVYSCAICGKTFSRQNNYRNHMRTHRVDRPYECTVCLKTFNTRLYLRRHLVIHSDKKYKCHYCDKEFNTSDGRGQHHKHSHKFELGLL